MRAIKFARELRCDVCKQNVKPRPEREAIAPRNCDILDGVIFDVKGPELAGHQTPKGVEHLGLGVKTRCGHLVDSGP